MAALADAVQPGQGALRRHLQLPRRAGARGVRDAARARHALPHPPAALFDARSLGRARRPAGRAGGGGRRLHRLLAARPGRLDRQISRRNPRRLARAARQPRRFDGTRGRHRREDRDRAATAADRQAAWPADRPSGAEMGAARRAGDFGRGRRAHIGADRRQPRRRGRPAARAVRSRRDRESAERELRRAPIAAPDFVICRSATGGGCGGRSASAARPKRRSPVRRRVGCRRR